MNDWIGHSVVAAIAALIILSAMVARNRVDNMVVTTMQMRSGKKLTLDVAAALERDMRNIGSNFPTYDLEPDSAVIDWKTDSTLNYFQFIGQANPGEPPALIRYDWQVVDSTLVGDEWKPLYKISRSVNGVLSRSTASVFTGVSFEFQNDVGLPASQPDELRQVDIRLVAVGTLGSSGDVRETRWNAVYRPQAIAREDNEDV